MAVTVDDHGVPSLIEGLRRPDATARGGIVKRGHDAAAPAAVIIRESG
jgi:hypothetical protein